MLVNYGVNFSGTDVWIKKDGDKDFDVTLGSYDGAKICELVGLYILHKLGEKYGKERIGLYRDDGLACFENTSGPEAERIRKAFIKLFKNELSLNIVSDTNIKVVIFLDLTLNLSTGKYEPYKPDNKPLYINVKSNHPPNIIKKLPESISRRINKLPSDKTIFNNSEELFNNFLFNSGFDHKIKFQSLTENKDRSRNKNRGRKIVWFNPPHSCNVATNIGKKFLLLLDKHFPKAHK